MAVDDCGEVRERYAEPVPLGLRPSRQGAQGDFHDAEGVIGAKDDCAVALERHGIAAAGRCERIVDVAGRRVARLSPG